MIFTGVIIFAVLTGMTVLVWIFGRDPPENGKSKGRRFITGMERLSEKIYFFIDERFRLKMAFSSAVSDLAKIRTGRSPDTIKKELFSKVISIIYICTAVSLLVIDFMIFLYRPVNVVKHDHYIMRNEPGMGSRKAEIIIKESGSKRSISLSVPERRYNARELDDAFNKGNSYIRSVFAGKNQSLDSVRNDLVLVRSIPDTALTVDWEISEPEIIEDDGTVHCEGLKKNTICYLNAVMNYGKKNERLEFTVRVIKKKVRMTHEMTVKKAIKKSLAEYQDSTYARLPENINGRKVSYSDKTKGPMSAVLPAVIFCIFMIFLYFADIHSKAEKRREQIKRGYPDFLEKFILLMGAGLTVRGSWIRMTDDYIKKRTIHPDSRNYLYEEMLITRYAMENGENDVKAIMKFGKRTGELNYIKFASLIEQNLKKGSADLLKLLDLEAHESFNIRRENAKQLGEKAGTKLLIPMTMMLVVVIAIIIFAAFQSM